MQTVAMRGGIADAVAAPKRLVFANNLKWTHGSFSFVLSVWADGTFIGEVRLEGVAGLSRFERERMIAVRVVVHPEPSVSVALLESSGREWARRNHRTLESIVSHPLAWLMPASSLDALNELEASR